MRYNKSFIGAYLSSIDDRVELNCATRELRSICLRLEKAEEIYELNDPKFIYQSLHEKWFY